MQDVFIIDYFKGFGAVMLTAIMRFDDSINDAWLINLRIIATIAVVLGHVFPIFAGFKGGKGVATLLGAGTGIYPPLVLICLYGAWYSPFGTTYRWRRWSLAAATLSSCLYSRR